MTDQMLRDLLEERVAGVTMDDLSAVAWSDGRRSRRRDGLAVVGCAGLVAAVVTTGIAVLGGDGRPSPTAPAPGVPTATSGAPDGSDAVYEGVPVWWSLDQQEEQELAAVDSPLPAVVDLEAGPLAKAIPYAVAAFSVGDRVRLVGPNGYQLSVGISRLEDVVKPNGYSFRPVHTSMLSPSGDYVVFPQNGSVAVYTVAGGQWRSIDTGTARTLDVTWYDDDTLLLPREGSGGAGPMWDVDGTPAGEGQRPRANPGFDVMTAQAYGQTLIRGTSSAQSWGMGVPVPVREPGRDVSSPDFLVATVGGTTSLLAIMWNRRDGRFKDCCPVAGWLADDVLVYESRQTEPVLVAWTVGTREFRQVSRIKGEYSLASFARLS